MRTKIIISVITIIAIISAFFFGTLWYMADKKVAELQSKIDAIKSMTTGNGNEIVRFISFDGKNLTYGVPTQTKVGDKTYIDYNPKTSRAGSSVKVPDIAEGARIQIHFSMDNNFQRYIDSVAIVPGI